MEFMNKVQRAYDILNRTNGGEELSPAHLFLLKDMFNRDYLSVSDENELCRIHEQCMHGEYVYDKYAEIDEEQTEEDRRMSKGHLNNILKCLEAYSADSTDKCKIIGYIHNDRTAIADYKNTHFYIWDNGGEIGMERINDQNGALFIPLTSWSTTLNALTMAYRLDRMIKGEVIDYNHVESDQASAIILKSMGLQELPNEYELEWNNLCAADDEEVEL